VMRCRPLPFVLGRALSSSYGVCMVSGQRNSKWVIQEAIIVGPKEESLGKAAAYGGG
jgi:hypothetical protein